MHIDHSPSEQQLRISDKPSSESVCNATVIHGAVASAAETEPKVSTLSSIMTEESENDTCVCEVQPGTSSSPNLGTATSTTAAAAAPVADNAIDSAPDNLPTATKTAPYITSTPAVPISTLSRLGHHRNTPWSAGISGSFLSRIGWQKSSKTVEPSTASSNAPPRASRQSSKAGTSGLNVKTKGTSITNAPSKVTGGIKCGRPTAGSVASATRLPTASSARLNPGKPKCSGEPSTTSSILHLVYVSDNVICDVIYFWIVFNRSQYARIIFSPCFHSFSAEYKLQSYFCCLFHL